MTRETHLSALGTRMTRWLDNPLVAAFLYPRTVDDYVALVDATWTRREHHARILAIDVRDDVVGMELRIRRALVEDSSRVALVATLRGRRESRDVRVTERSATRVTVAIARTRGCPLASWASTVASTGDVVVLERAGPTRSIAAKLVFRESKVSVDTDTSLPILVQAEQAGLRPTAGCRRGVCHRCACTLVAGSVTNVRTGEVTTDRGSIIRPCVSVPTGFVEVDL